MQTTGSHGGPGPERCPTVSSHLLAGSALAQQARGWHGSRPRRVHSQLNIPSGNRSEPVQEANSYRSRTPFEPGYPPSNETHTPAPAQGREAWIARARQLGLSAAPGSEAFNAALLLVASVDIGPNVERLSRRTGVPRPFASKCGRRLVDSGVWSGGCTVGEWVADPTLPFVSDAFLQDVAVAEGRLLRRVGTGGRFEWAPIGRWTKSFDGSGDEDASTATWVEAAPQPDEVVALAEEREDPARPGVNGRATTSSATPSPAPSATVVPTPIPQPNGTADSDPAPKAEDRPAPATARPDHPASSTPAPASAAPDELSAEDPTAPDEPTPSLEEVFSGAVWLR